jgi:DNA invertase Pin-like site-specific DNA recombinase
MRLPRRAEPVSGLFCRDAAPLPPPVGLRPPYEETGAAILILIDARSSPDRRAAIFTDEGISGAKGRDKRPGFDNLLKGVARRDFQMIMAWSVDRLGRSLPHLVGFLGDIQAKDVDLYLHQQGLDTSTPSGRAMFGMLGVFAEFERAMIRERILSGLRRTTKKSGRKPMPADRLEAIKKSLSDGLGIRATARRHSASPMTVTKIVREMAPEAQAA